MRPQFRMDRSDQPPLAFHLRSALLAVDAEERSGFAKKERLIQQPAAIGAEELADPTIEVHASQALGAVVDGDANAV